MAFPDARARSRRRVARAGSHGGPAQAASHIKGKIHIWDRKQGHVTLADLDLVLIRCVRSRGHAALPPERWRRRPWASATRHEWSLEA